MYWKCIDCDDMCNEENIKAPLLMIFESLRNILNHCESGDFYTNNSADVKREPSESTLKEIDIKTKEDNQTALNGDAEDIHDDDNFIDTFDEEGAGVDDCDENEDDLRCFPQRGYLCELCQFSTFDLTEFQNHIEYEKQQIIVVQQSISSPHCEKTCIKCDQKLDTTNLLYEHVTKYHSRPSDFPQFGDTQWKYLMAGENAKKRSCSYCGAQFTETFELINHLKRSIMGEIEDPKDEQEKSDFTIGPNGQSQNVNGTDELLCVECKPEQKFKSHDSLKWVPNKLFFYQ